MSITSIMPPPVERATTRCVSQGFLRVIWYVFGCSAPRSTMLILTAILAALRWLSESTRRASWASHPRNPPKSPMSEPWALWVVARDPLGSKSMSISENFPSMRSWQMRPIRSEAAQCELDGPRITGPSTSLKMLGYCINPFFG